MLGVFPWHGKGGGKSCWSCLATKRDQQHWNNQARKWACMQEVFKPSPSKPEASSPSSFLSKSHDFPNISRNSSYAPKLPAIARGGLAMRLESSEAGSVHSWPLHLLVMMHAFLRVSARLLLAEHAQWNEKTMFFNSSAMLTWLMTQISIWCDYEIIPSANLVYKKFWWGHLSLFKYSLNIAYLAYGRKIFKKH